MRKEATPRTSVPPVWVLALHISQNPRQVNYCHALWTLVVARTLLSLSLSLYPIRLCVAAVSFPKPTTGVLSVSPFLCSSSFSYFSFLPCFNQRSHFALKLCYLCVSLPLLPQSVCLSLSPLLSLCTIHSLLLSPFAFVRVISCSNFVVVVHTSVTREK